MPDKKVDFETVAQRLSVSRSHIERLLQAGELKGIYVGVKPNTGKRIYWSSVLDFEARRKVDNSTRF